MTAPLPPQSAPRAPVPVRALLDDGREAWKSGRRDAAIRCWRMAAAAAPGHGAAAYINLARTGTVAGWVEQVAGALAPGDPAVLRNLGVLAGGRGADAEARGHLKRSLVLAPDRAASSTVFAKLAPAGEPEAAAWAVRAAVSDPADERVWFRLVALLTGSGQWNEAGRRAAAIPLPLERWSDELLHLAFQAYIKSGREPAAVPVVTLLVRRRPADPRARGARAVLRRRCGDLHGALREATRAMVLAPGDFNAAAAVSTEACHTEHYAQAVRLYRRCLRIAPGRRDDILENYAVSLQQSGQYAEGDALQREVLVQTPALDSSWMNMSVSAFRADDLERASRYGEYAVVAGPALAGAPFNLAGVRRHQGRAEEARRLLARAIELSGDKPDYLFSRSLLELGDGDPVFGLAAYDSRWDVPDFPSYRRLRPQPSFAIPVWQGEPRPDATLAVWGEQGVGDEIWFAGYLDWAVRRVGGVVLEVAAHLVGLMQRTFPDVDVRPRDDRETDRRMAAADLQVPMGGIMVPYGAATRPAPTGYLATDPARVAALRARYAGGREGVRVIGVSWRSVKPKRTASFESRLEHWRPILELPDAVFVSLQYGDVAADVREARERFGVELIVDPEIDAYRDLDAFAAQVAATDTVVSIANSTVAMAHGLGKPVHVLLKAIQEDWRYARHHETTRWLPTARCAWQRTPGDWSAPVATVAGWLREG